MAHRFHFSTSVVALAVVALTLSACQATTPAANKDVTPLNTVPPIVDDGQYRGLEQRVQTLEGQMKAAQPTLKKVDAIESHFKALSLELDKIAATYPMEETVVTSTTPVPAVITKEVFVPPVADVKKPETKKETKTETKTETKKVEPKKADVKAPALVPDVFAVTSVRVGEQAKDMTRIVLDTTSAAEIHYDLDNTEGLLVIDIPKAKWATTPAQAFPKSPMVKSFKAMSDDSGAHFVTDLKQKAKVVATARLAPSGTSGHRVYIDIAPLK